MGETLSQQDEAHQRLMKFMLNGRTPMPKRSDPTRNPAHTAQPSRRRGAVDADLDSGLRALGLNRPEREELRRGQRRRKTPAGNREKRKALLRIGFYIDQKVDWTATELIRNEVIALWAGLCKHDVDKAIRWWTQGVHPLDIIHITTLMDSEFEPTDLYRVVNDRTVLEHLHDGQSIEWCLGALRFSLRS